MTCILGLAHDGIVTIAGDSACTTGQTVDLHAEGKLGRNANGVIFGTCGSPRLRALMKWADLPTVPAFDADLDRYFEFDLPNAMRQIVRDEHAIDSGGMMDSSMIVGFADRLYYISRQFCTTRNATDYNACGSGSEVAYGSLHTTAELGLPAQRRIDMALNAAAAHVGSVAGPFTSLSTAPLALSRAA